MPDNKNSFHPYPKYNPESEAITPSFFFDISIENKTVHVEIQPLLKVAGYFGVKLDKIFLAHIHKLGKEWYDMMGSNRDIYQVIGKKIDEFLRNLSF